MWGSRRTLGKLQQARIANAEAQTRAAWPLGTQAAGHLASQARAAAQGCSIVRGQPAHGLIVGAGPSHDQGEHCVREQPAARHGCEALARACLVPSQSNSFLGPGARGDLAV